MDGCFEYVADYSMPQLSSNENVTRKMHEFPGIELFHGDLLFWRGFEVSAGVEAE